MRVVFLALGATRRRAVIEESAQVLADGGTAVVLVDTMAPWRRETFAPGVEVVEVAEIERQHHLPRTLEALFLYRVPIGLLYRVFGYGPLRELVHRVARVYKRRFANRVHRRIFLPVYRRLWSEVRAQLVHRHVLGATPFDILVVADPVSLPDAVRLLTYYTDPGTAVPRVAYSLDHAIA